MEYECKMGGVTELLYITCDIKEIDTALIYSFMYLHMLTWSIR